jgi:CHAD domain-containing protein
MNAVRMEIEAKYVVPDAPTFDRLLALEALGDYRLAPRGEERIADRYLDTPGRDLWRGGYACRVRERAGGHTWTLCLKGLGGARGAVHQREEHEVDVPAGAAPIDWPEGPVRRLVLRFAPVQSLEALFTLRQDRTLRDLHRESRHVAVVSLDRVEIEAAAAHVTYEMEIELTSGGRLTDLNLLGKLLRPFGLRPQPHSKFERALHLVDAARARPSRRKSPGVLADEPMAEAGRKILRFHCDRMLASEPGTRAGLDSEELHQMRVATRRQRAALRIVASRYRRKAVAPARAGLRTLGQRLGAVRDLDVLLEKTATYQAALEPTAARALQPLVDAWQARHAEARRELLAHFDGHGYAAFKESYGAFLDTPGAGVRRSGESDVPRPSLVAHVVPAEVWAHYGALRAFEPSLRWASVPALHALRIEGKRLRYVLEFFREVLDPCVEPPIDAMVALQDHLGELHDADVTVELIREFLAGPTAASHAEAAAAAGGYLEFCAAHLEALRRGVKRPWRAVANRQFRVTLARAVAGL